MTRPDFDGDPLAAMQVHTFMEAGERGRWRLHPFTVTEEGAALRLLKDLQDAGRSKWRRERVREAHVPPGDYISLQRTPTDAEIRDDEDLKLQSHIPVMSDTPYEIYGHQHALAFAEGRVLVNGLGLGCIVSALIEMPHVEHIDVVEIDPDVIALTGPYYEHPKVTIHSGNALRLWWDEDDEFDGPERDEDGFAWDYVWHDIWTHISERNLETETAEHGIAYPDAFDRFEDVAANQGAWAYDFAIESREATREFIAEQREFERKLWAAPHDERVEMLFEVAIRDKMTGIDGEDPFEGKDIPPEIRQFWIDAGLRAHLDKALGDPSLRERFERERDEAAQTPIGNPNAHLEGS